MLGLLIIICKEYEKIVEHWNVAIQASTPSSEKSWCSQGAPSKLGASTKQLFRQCSSQNSLVFKVPGEREQWSTVLLAVICEIRESLVQKLG